MADAPKSFAKLHALQEIEKRAQKKWNDLKVFEVEAPVNKTNVEVPKFMATFPFPYMNGRLHVGHTFTVSKAEFACAYERLKGKRALFPFGFHCSGMPIKACADKLKREVEIFGKNFEKFVDEPAEPETPPEPVQKSDAPVDPTKVVKKHGKAASKNTGLKWQFQIMRTMDVPNEEIHKFADPEYWLSYFPPRVMDDLKALGVHVDWRRSFITTDTNPYFDSFVRWQFNVLKSLPKPKVKFGERYTIYSPLDGQACMDHDRSSGEGVGVQEYTCIKLEVLMDDLKSVPVESRDKVKDVPVGQKLTSKEVLAALKGKKLFLVAATLRPETMYGQTNCYVGVDLEYGIYEANDKEAYVCTERSAKNMAFQSLFKERGSLVKLAALKGSDLIGVPLKAPLAQFPKVYTLPMEGVLATKGTGVVTSVPSDSPDDYITMQDLIKKAAYYNVQSKWVEPFMPPKPIIQTPNYGNLAAVTAVEKLKIRSQKDKVQLAEAKELVYKEGFYSGVMLVGPQKGKPVQEAKPVIREMLIKEGLGFAYCEPEGVVISRSGDECVVTLADQWYIDYGEEEWRATTERCLAKMDTFAQETRNAFEKTLGWLNNWACSRSFGLGSRIPWDPQYLVESLSDSTIYMAYYTVCHILQGAVDGSKPNPAFKIDAADMTDEVWSHVLLDKPAPKKTKISKETLALMKREFNYFYPLDLRVSGKDLVPNHLTFFLYNHTAIFPEKHWPRGVRSNGHLLLDSEKMSKSTGNFLTLAESIARYGADATRFAIADAGDGLDDANFLHKTADDAVLKLFTEKEWCEELIAELNKGEQKPRTGKYSWNDRVFDAEMSKICIEADRAYGGMQYKAALKLAFYNLQAAKSEYRKATLPLNTNTISPITVDGESYEGYHKDVITRFLEIQALLLAPITPHWSEYIWSELLKKPKSIQLAVWPEPKQPVDEGILSAAQYIRDVIYRVRAGEDLAAKKRAKAQQKAGKGAAAAAPPPTGPRKLTIVWAANFPEWQDACMVALRGMFDASTGTFDKEVPEALKKDKNAQAFISLMKRNVAEKGPSALERALAFDEVETLNANKDFIRRDLATLKVETVEILSKDQAPADLDVSKAVPGEPAYRLA
ncbi:cytosolic leucyl tRNA synthetase [Irineochytrium annulatum]|nr:cytosolic leucyl tRNA synthetase [Irineochytrium annulatum]